MFVNLLHRIVSRPWVYDRVQMLLGLSRTHQRLTPYLADAVDQTILDVGAGTGLVKRLLPEGSNYIWFDKDPLKLEGYKPRRNAHHAVLGDATQICLKDQSVDLTLCISLLHHLSDEHLSLLFDELARVTRQRLIFLDPVEHSTSRISKLLWRYDRGAYPRSGDALCSRINQWFEIEQIERYAIYHQYLLCVAKSGLNGMGSNE